MSTARAPIRVLYVDSDPAVADAAATYLERVNNRFDVVTAHEAREGRERITEGEFDCVVSHHELPDRNGLEFLEQLREERPELPLFLVGDLRGERASVAELAAAADLTDSVRGRAGTAQYDRLASLIVEAVPDHEPELADDRTEEPLSAFAERTDIVFWVFDPQWTDVEFVNAAHEAVYGQPRSALRNRPRALLDAVHPDDREQVRQAMDWAADGESVTLAHRADAATEYSRWVRVRIEPITDGETVVRIVGCATEITEQKEREQELKRQNDRLLDFASVVSHDLRNPLNVAQGRLELARRENDNDHLEAVSRAQSRMESLIEDLLTLARQGRSVTQTQTVDLAETVEQCWPIADREEASLVVETAQSIEADESRLQQLIDNLVHNAIEHGGEDVTVTIGALADGFYVADDGPGIPEEWREDVFESGYSTNEDGTGFGLSIVEEIVDAHGWSIDVTSSETGGARFELTDVDVVRNDERDAEDRSPVEQESHSS
jgi:PAS domain S-box-containing protein